MALFPLQQQQPSRLVQFYVPWRWWEFNMLLTPSRSRFSPAWIHRDIQAVQCPRTWRWHQLFRSHYQRYPRQIGPRWSRQKWSANDKERGVSSVLRGAKLKLNLIKVPPLRAPNDNVASCSLQASIQASESLMMLMVNYSQTAEFTFSKTNIYNAQNALDAAGASTKASLLDSRAQRRNYFTEQLYSGAANFSSFMACFRSAFKFREGKTFPLLARPQCLQRFFACSLLRPSSSSSVHTLCSNCIRCYITRQHAATMLVLWLFSSPRHNKLNVN